ncbi:hypothetical protein [Clostridium ganghwense]|uniref:Large ribosomal subunit protein bL25 L25 domain-containing protein n=1 Tax=Clostridium ganghwense TaxID=312089 RepID=A0ABT4CKL2_9CLOT|nr:hypothetical protein [Clostridium ganghwense]MCY6369590.1 hypothetical protein [Clostridium ganghwense]
MNELLASVRDVKEKAKKARRVGKLPGILYGGKRGNIPFYIMANEFQKYIARKGERSIVYINLNGEKIKARIIGVQRHLAGNQVISVDLKELSEDVA